MSSIWNLLNPLRTGFVKLAPSGKELYGTVIKHGLMAKTATVSVDFQFWNNKFRKYYHSSSRYLVHDEENYCVTGDKVVISVCRPISQRKHYYIRNVVKPFPRHEYYDSLTRQKDAVLDEEYRKLMGQYMRNEYKSAFIKTKKQDAELKGALKAKALSKAMMNIRRQEAQKMDKIRQKAEKINASESHKQTPK